MNPQKLFELSPALEIAVRNLYWRNPGLAAAARRGQELWQRRAGKGQSRTEAATTIGRVLPALREWGLGKGDLVVLHSGYRALRADGAKPDAIIDAILEVIGPSGTLAAPGICHYSDEPQQHDRITADVTNLICDYDPASTPMWTGAVPNALLKRAGARRSLHPLNSMIVLGPLTDEILRDNLAGDRPYPCGPSSSWAACARLGAKVLAIGADMAHSLTMIHVAEDVLGDEWPVRRWYRERQFRVRIGDEWHHKVVRERHPRWAMYYGERTLSRDLHDNGLCFQTSVDGVNVEALPAGEMLSYLRSRHRSLYPYFYIPLHDRKGR